MPSSWSSPSTRGAPTHKSAGRNRVPECPEAKASLAAPAFEDCRISGQPRVARGSLRIRSVMAMARISDATDRVLSGAV